MAHANKVGIAVGLAGFTFAGIRLDPQRQFESVDPSTEVSQTLVIKSISMSNNGEIRLYPKDWGLYRFLSYQPLPEQAADRAQAEKLRALCNSIPWYREGDLDTPITVNVVRRAVPQILDSWYGTESYQVKSLQLKD